MAWIDYNGEKYTMKHWKVQCLNCDYTLQTWNCVCSCGLVVIKEGQRVWPYPPVKDVSLWSSPSGKTLPQRVLDNFLSREANKTSTNTKTSTGTS